MQETQPTAPGARLPDRRTASGPAELPDLQTAKGSAWLTDPVLLAGLVAVAAANALLWAFTIPFNEAPDEAAHFQVVRFILDHGRLPVFHPDDIWLLNTSKGVVESYAPFPPLAYVVGALASQLTDGTMWGARLVSSTSYVATVALTFLIARHLVPRSVVVAVCAALVVAFLPQFAFTAAYVNNDAIGVALSALLFYLLIRLRSGEYGVWLLLGIGATAGALLLTKYTFYPAAAVGFIVAALQARRPIPVTALFVGAAAICGWWFARNLMLYGELVPVRVIAEAKAAAGGNTLFVPADYGITLLDLSVRTDFWWASFTSFVGKFGFLSIEMHPGYYLACLALVALALAGRLVRLRVRPRGPDDLAAFGFGLAVLGGTAIFAIASSAYGEYSPQGRYLFAALVPVAIGLVVGWSWLGALAPALRMVPIGATLWLIVLNFVALFEYVIPVYFGDGAGRVVMQLDPPPDSTANPAEVEGWALIEGGFPWRPYWPAAVAAYREPAAEVRVSEDSPPPDGRLLSTGHYGLKRTDVADFYGGFRGLENVGYRVSWPQGLLQDRADLPQELMHNRRVDIFICASAPGAKTGCAGVHAVVDSADDHTRA